MSKCYIPDIDFQNTNKLQLFVLTRPFYKESGWCNNLEVKQKWGIDDSYEFTNRIEEATLLLIPLPVNLYVKTNQLQDLKSLNEYCITQNIKGYGYISGDFGQAYPEFSNLIYFRMGGFKRQLSTKNLGFPISLSDHFQKLYGLENPVPRQKPTKPLVGFCGHATKSTSKRIKELVKCLLENGKRFLQNPLRRDWEPLFASAYERWQLLKLLEQSSELDCRFIYREKYRGGATTKAIQEQTTKDYYENLYQSDYVLCVRGAGNFSVRFYEALLMGKIPIFVNTDCLLPLDDEIDWKRQVVWLEWQERHQIAEKVVKFHSQLTNETFRTLQQENRMLWKEKLTVTHYLNKISHAV